MSKTRQTFTAALAAITATASASVIAGDCQYKSSAMKAGYIQAAVYQPQATPSQYGTFHRTGHHASADHAGMGQAGMAPKADIVAIAASAGSFDTLVAAIEAAGLVDTLKGDGPFTVFAPTDEAFAKIPQDKLDTLLQDRDALTAVLTYHVVPGKVMAQDVTELSSAKTVQGQSLRIDTSDGVKVDNANVIKTDIVARNGVIHVIDSVIIPN